MREAIGVKVDFYWPRWVWAIVEFTPFRWVWRWRLRTHPETPTSIFRFGPFGLIWWHRG